MARSHGRPACVYSLRALPHLLAEPHLDQRLIGHVAFVGGDFDLLQQADGKTQRNRGRARLQVWKAHSLGAAPVEVRRRILALPDGALTSLAPEPPRCFTRLRHKWSFP